MSDVSQPKFLKKVIFKKFLIQKFLCSSAFSWVYEGKNLNKNEPVAIKIEKNKSQLLESEAYLLMHLKGFGIPEIVSFGKHGPYKILIEELLGPTISFLWESKPFKKDPYGTKNLYIKDLCLLALQTIERLRYVHSKNVVHRDIKDKNFIIGRKDPQNIYIIDFGFSKKYRSSRTGKHIKFSNLKTLIGSVLFTSRYAIKGYESSRRDDLESLGYLLTFFGKGGWLPWLNMYSNPYENKIKKIERISVVKQKIKEEELCKGLPEEFITFMKYVRSLGFEQDPNYSYMQSLFISMLSKRENVNNAHFFWVKKSAKNEKKPEDSNKNNSLYNKSNKNESLNIRKNQSLNRLYSKIKNSLSKKNKRFNCPTLVQSRNIQFSTNARPYIYTDKISSKTISLTANNSAVKNIKMNTENKIPKADNIKNKPAQLWINNNRTNNNIQLIKNEKNLFKNIYQNPRDKKKSNKIPINGNNKTFNSKKNFILNNNINYNNMYFIDNDTEKKRSMLNKSTNESKKHSANSSVNEIKFEKNIIYIPRFKQSIKLKNYLG